MKHCLRFGGIVAVLVLGWAFFGCAGPSKKAETEAEPRAAEQKGSMSQTFTLVDEQGRKAGTLTVQPFGGAVLRDADGTVLKEFQPGGSPQLQPAPTSTETQVEMPSEPDAPEMQSTGETQVETPVESGEPETEHDGDEE
jgi:hypothetical protein